MKRVLDWLTEPVDATLGILLLAVVSAFIGAAVGMSLQISYLHISINELTSHLP